MVEGKPGLDTALVEGGEHLAIAGKGGFVKDAGARFDAAPFKAEAMAVEAEGGDAVEVGFGVFPPIAGDAAALPINNRPRLLLEARPLIVVVVAFGLMRGGGCSPTKANGKHACSRHLVIVGRG